MDRREYTPTKSSKYLSANTQYSQISRQPVKELSIVRQFQALKLQARQLQIVNRQLAADSQKLLHEKNMNESKFLQKVSYEEEAMSQFQKEKNYQIDMLRLKNEEDLARVKRQYEIKIEDVQRQIASRQLQGKQLKEKYSLLQLKSQQARATLEKYQLELIKLRDNNSSLTQSVTREEFANKKLEMLAEELQRQRNEMEDEIHVLLDIQAEKTRTISHLDSQLQQTEGSVANLNDKLTLLTENFGALQEHISVMKERLLNAQMRGQDLDRQLQSTQLQISDKDQLHYQQKERELKLRDEIEAHRQRQTQRIHEIKQLISDNQRIYSDINSLRFRLYDISIDKGCDL